MRIIPALLVITVCVPALADEPAQLPEVVVTATRVPTPVQDIPAGVTVITRQDIEAHGYNTLVQALSDVPGLRVSPSGGPGQVASVFIRGTDSNQVLVLRDGMPITDASDANGAFNFGVDTLADVERIEIIRGPMASLYGSGAIGGVINLISRRGHAPGLHVQTDLAGGYPAEVRGSVAASGVQGSLDYAATVESQSQRGYDYVPQRMSIYTGTPQGYRDRIGTLNLGYTPVDGTRLSLFLRGREAIYGFNNLGSPTFDNSNSTGQDDSVMGRVGVDSLLFGGSYETRMYLGALQDDRLYTETLVPQDPNQQSEDSRYHSRRVDFQWNNTLHLSDFLRSPVLSNADLTFGYEHIADSVHVRVASAFQGSPYSQSADASMIDDAAYAGLQGTLWQRLTITGQVRQDWVAGSTPTTWRLGAVLDVPGLHTRLKTAYGTAFLAPSLFDRYGVDSFGYVGNANLKPESAQGWETGFTTTLPAFARADFISFGATYFNEQVRNLITTVYSATSYTTANVGSAHIQGITTTLGLHPLRWLRMQASYTFTDAQNADTGERLLRRPQNTADFSLDATPIGGLHIVPQLEFTGAFQDYLFNDAGFSTGLIGSSGQGLIANLTATYDVTPRAQIYLDAHNIFDSRFEPVNGYQTPGPNVLVGVRLHL